MNHQVQVQDSEEEVLILDAPTSAGKTLACVLRVVKCKKNAIFLYPTNQLMLDQARSIASVLRDDLGKKVKITPIEVDSFQIKENHNEKKDEAEYTIIVANGDVLEDLSRIKGRAKGSALDELLERAQGSIILLTNIDLLFLILKQWYARSKLLLQKLLSFELLVIDEFHMYQGIMLANLLFLLWPLRNLFKQIIISSATHTDSVNCLKELFEVTTVTARENTEGFQVRHDVKLEIQSSPGILYTARDLDRMVKIVERLYDKTEKANVSPKVLVIVNSVFFCDRLAEKLTQKYGYDKVSPIHGFVPKRERKIRADIVVGTSAIEMGVDFDVASIVFEATDAASFIQRLGRGGRHRNCEAVAIIPTSVYRYFPVRDGERVSYETLQGGIYSKMDQLPTYTEFLKSQQAAYIYIGLIYAVVLGFKDRVSSPRTETLNLVTNPVWKPPFISTEHIEYIMGFFPTKILKPIAKAGARGDLMSLPAYDRRYETYFHVNIFDLTKLDFELCASKEELQHKIARKLPPWVQEGPFAIINKLGEYPTLFKGFWREFTDIQVITPQKLSLNLGDDELERRIIAIMDGKPAYASTNTDDWRFAFILNERIRNLKLIIGLNGFIQKFLDETRNALQK